MYSNEKTNVTLNYFRSSLLFDNLDLYSYSNIRNILFYSHHYVKYVLLPDKFREKNAFKHLLDSTLSNGVANGPLHHFLMVKNIFL